MYSRYRKIMMSLPASIAAFLLSAAPVFAASEPSTPPPPANEGAVKETEVGKKTVSETPRVVSDSFGETLISTYQNNPRIKAQQKALTALDENVSQAHSGWLPSAEANYSNGRQRVRSRPSSDEGWNYGDTETKGLTVVQPIFQGGETLAQTDRAENLVIAGRADLRITEQQVLLEAITAYMDVLRDQSVLDLSRNNQEVLKKQMQARLHLKEIICLRLKKMGNSRVIPPPMEYQENIS